MNHSSPVSRKGFNLFLALCMPYIFFGCAVTKKQSVVSSATPDATKAGLLILQKGGNAIDAAVAVSFALGVTESAMSGLGGGTQMLIGIPGKEPFLINGTTFSPALTDSTIAESLLKYHKRTTIPSTVKVLAYAWKNYGSGKVSWQELLAPAIALAKDGFTVGRFRAAVYKQYEKSLTTSPYNTSYWLKDGKQIPKDGDVIYQPVLARTLERIATQGAEDFYTGEIAKAISKDMELNGGWIRYEDLKNFKEPKEVPALHIKLNGYDVYSMPPPGAGYAVLQMLKLNEKVKQQEPKISEFALWAKVLKAVHNDREAHPLNNLTINDAEVQKRLSDSYVDGLYQPAVEIKNPKETGGETTHFSVVDKNGIAVAVTASINAYFGAVAAAPDLGFLYNTYMDDFEFEKPGHPGAVRPHAMAFSSMSPTIVNRNGKTQLIVGTPGSKRIISTVAQITATWMEEKDIHQALLKRRFHVDGKNFYIEDLKLADSLLQSGLPGYTIRKPGTDLQFEGWNSYFGGVHAIARQKGKWKGAADIRRDGTAGEIRKK